MKLVVRLGAFAIGAAGAILLIGVLNNTFPWFWLPVLMGIAISIVVGSQQWFITTRLAGLFCCALTLGCTLTFAITTLPVTTFFGSMFPKLLQFICLCLFLICLGLFVARGLTQRKTAKMTAWLLVPIAAACVLGCVSGGVGGGNHMIYFAMHYLHMTKDQADIVVHYVRKTIHFSAYGFLGLSCFRAAIAGSAAKGRAIAFALLCILCLASFDEMRQTTAPNRTGSPWDVALDMTGSSFFVLVAAALSRNASNPEARSGANM